LAKRVPIDPAKLIEAAEEFAKQKGGKGRPRPVLLRRAVSTAYYALYHGLTRTTAEHLLPSGSDEDQLKITRPYLDPISQSFQGTPLFDVAMILCDLQEARHKADYDHLETFSKQATVGLVADARKALKTLDASEPKDREAFLALLAMSLRN
jgi:uncharacterized protein (UPF0332 family)